MKLILDVDVGVDDALAIAYAAASPDAELIGLTATFGNVSSERSARNCLGLLELLGMPGVPVLKGADHAWAARSFAPRPATVLLHGRNGTSDVEIPAAPRRGIGTVPAADFIAEAVRRHGGDLRVVAVGAPTNVADALRRHPGIAPDLHLVMMGGALAIQGNVSPFAEANVDQDPEAARFILDSECDVTMVGLDVTMRALAPRAFFERLRARGRAGAFLAEVAERYMDADAEHVEPALGGRCALHDPLAAAIALDPSLAGYLKVPLTVECEGPSRGRTIGSTGKLLRGEPCARVAVTVDAARFEARFEERLLGLARDLEAAGEPAGSEGGRA